MKPINAINIVIAAWCYVLATSIEGMDGWRYVLAMVCGSIHLYMGLTQGGEKQ